MSRLKNYRSVFFEDDLELEMYHRKIKDALQVQLQKEVNISIDIVKQKYHEWADLLKHQFRKTSQCKLPHNHIPQIQIFIISALMGNKIINIVKKTIVFDLDETLVRV